MKKNVRRFNSQGLVYTTKAARLKIQPCLLLATALLTFTTVVVVNVCLGPYAWGQLRSTIGSLSWRGFLPICPKTTFFTGRINISDPSINRNTVQLSFPGMAVGGHHTPQRCRSTEKVAVVIPYRNRAEHLDLLLLILVPILIKQNVEFTIFIAEQVSPNPFNKGLLSNAAYLETLKIDTFDCFVFHDVDMVPVDDRNLYRCNSSGPVHMAASINKYNYSTMYDGYFGGVVAFTTQQYRAINGASNLYFGWGAEDDDLRDRVRHKNLTLFRKSKKYGVYNMLVHGEEVGAEKNPDRFKVYGNRLKRQDYDGLNSVVYSLTSLVLYKSYTWMGIAYDKTQVEHAVPDEVRYGDMGDFDFMKSEFVEID